MSDPREPIAEPWDDELEDPEGEEIDLPPRMQAKWRRSGGLRRMPREMDRSEAHPSKPRRSRKQGACGAGND